MKAVEVAVEPRLLLTLPGAGFADAYRITCAAQSLDARQASLAIFDRTPQWVNALMRVRNGIMALFGVKPGLRQPGPRGRNHVGIFPVLLESPQELLLGMDDRHLDFRVAVSVQPSEAGAQEVTVTTVVHTHNQLGRAYLMIILPFHRLIARTMLKRAAESWLRPA